MPSHIDTLIGSILIVDDDEYVIKALKRLLRLSCSQIFTALSGEEALLILATQQIDVIMSDSLTPPINGIELLRRSRNIYPEITTILLSGQSTLNGIRLAKDEGILQTFIPKPWDDKQLIRTIRDTCAINRINKTSALIDIDRAAI